MTGKRTHIAVAVDFSPSAELALHHAVRLARHDGARLTAVHVVGGYMPDVGWPSIWAVPTEDARQRMSDVLDGELDEMLAALHAPDVELRRQLLVGDPHKELTQWCAKTEVDLLVVSPTGKSGFERMVLGSTARAVLHASRLPLWFARGEPVAQAAVVVGVDLADGGSRVLDAAVSEAVREGARLEVVHAHPDPGEERIFAVSSWEDQHRYRELIVGEHRDKFRTWCLEHVPDVAGLYVERKTVPGKPWRALAAVAAEFDHALIVVGRHEHGAMHQLFAGSTTDAIVRRAPGPVLVIP